MKVHATDFIYRTVSDIGASVAFYRDVLGLEVEFFDEEMGWAEFALPPTTLALGQDGPGIPMSPGAGGTGIAVAVDDVEAALDELREEGLSVEMEFVETSVCDMAMVGDPDGNAIMLHRRYDGTHGRRDPLP